MDPQSFIGRPVKDLPTPSLAVSKPILESNINRLHQDLKALGIPFRPHVKTLKSLEVTRMMLGNGLYRSIIASTLPEIEGALPLVKEGILDEALYSMPIYPSILPRLSKLSQSLSILLLIDNDEHITLLEDFAKTSNRSTPWPVFIKIDVGTHRAGVENSSSTLPALVQRVEASPAVSLYGFYCHAGHSYACRTQEEAAQALKSEVEGVVSASKHLSGQGQAGRKVVLSIGSTPTAHVVDTLKEGLAGDMVLELHAGNFPCNDLQQVSTGLVSESQQAVRVLAEVASVYPERNEALINAGTIALSKETSDTPGYGKLADLPQWSVLRTSQEHGILATKTEGERVEKVFRIGDKVLLYCNHACITSAAYGVYYVVDKEDIVREAWVPWRGW